MLKEFAVDPAVIASSFETCRYLVSQFGADKGRLISKYPNRWKRMAFEAAENLPDGYKKERVVEYINSLGNEFLILVAAYRAYPSPGDSWLDNARAAHQERPFSAIVCDQDDPANQLIDANTCDENTKLFSAHGTFSVKRCANDIAHAAELVLKNCRHLRLVDPYFDPGRPKWCNPLREILALIPDIRRVECEYHIGERDDSPSTEQLIRRLGRLRGIIPERGVLRIIRWRERDGGERFHRRYLLTDNAGLQYEGGLDEEMGADQTTDVSLLDQRHHAERWANYNRDSQVYQLFEPILIVDAAGNVTSE